MTQIIVRNKQENRVSLYNICPGKFFVYHDELYIVLSRDIVEAKYKVCRMKDNFIEYLSTDLMVIRPRSVAVDYIL